MCKLVIFTEAPYAKQPAKQAKLLDKILTSLAVTDRDGLGITYIDGGGKLLRRRWATSADYKGLKVDDCRAPFCVEASDSVTPRPAAGFVMLHGRTSTRGKGLDNAHPHLAYDRDGNAWSLIHNGVVHVTKADEKTLNIDSACDSEYILRAWILGGMPKVSAMIRGYYAFGLIESLVAEANVLHIVKDATATLYAGNRKDGSYVFATTSNLLEIAEVKEYAKVQDLVHISFDECGGLLGMEDIPAPYYVAKESYTPAGGFTYGQGNHGSGYGSERHVEAQMDWQAQVDEAAKKAGIDLSKAKVTETLPAHSTAMVGGTVIALGPPKVDLPGSTEGKSASVLAAEYEAAITLQRVMNEAVPKGKRRVYSFTNAKGQFELYPRNKLVLEDDPEYEGETEQPMGDNPTLPENFGVSAIHSEPNSADLAEAIAVPRDPDVLPPEMQES